MILDHSDVARLLRQQLTPNPNQESPWHWGSVTAIDSTNFTVSVQLDGAVTTAGVAISTPNIRYLNAYTPTVGDTVLVGHMQGSCRTALFVIDKLAA